MAKFLKLGQFLRSKRVKANLTQSEASKALGYSSAQFVSDWERGIAAPPVVIFKSLARLYKFNAKELFDQFIRETTSNFQDAFKKSKIELS